MINKLKPKSDFNRNIFTLMTGTAVAQAIPILASPLLTRLYTPEDFGIFGIFMSIVTIGAIFVTGRYDYAILLSKTKNETNHLISLSMYSSFLLSIITYILLFNYQGILTNYFNNLKIDIWIMLIPISILFTAYFQTFSAVLNRNKDYIKMSKVKVMISISVLLLTIIFAFIINRNLGQIYGYLFGHIFVSFYLFYFLYKNNYIYRIQISKIKYVFFKHIKFLKFSTPSDIFNSFSNIGFPLLISIAFNPIVTGLYYLSNKIIRLPLSLIFSSISGVYTQKAAELYNKKEYIELIKLTNNIQKRILIILLPFSILVSLISPFLFGFVFGEDWILAGEYVRYYIVFVFFNGLYSPISQIGNILNRQDFLLKFNFSLGFFMAFSIYLFSNIYSFKITLLITSIIGSIHFIYLNIYMNYKLRRLK